jgi:hypothetical protein
MAPQVFGGTAHAYLSMVKLYFRVWLSISGLFQMKAANHFVQHCFILFKKVRQAETH